METALTLSAPLTDLPGLGPVRAKALERMDLRTVADLLTHYPRRYEDRRQFDHFPNAAGDKPVCVCGVVVGTATKRLQGRRQLFEATLQEPERHALSSLLKIRWFNTYYVAKIFAAGQKVVIYGKPKAYGKTIVIDHPEFEIIETEDEENLIHLKRITPVYATTEGLSQRVLRRTIYQLLQSFDLRALPTPLPVGMDPLPRGVALRDIHFPETDEHREAARRHLVISEFFGLQMLISARRAQTVSRPGQAHCGAGVLLGNFYKTLPFPLTGAQQRAVAEIRTDLAAARPMNRLLQGDVGSGKTLVALSAMLLAVEAGFQSAIMAPTQILAEQHYLGFTRLLAGTGLRVALRTNSRREESQGGERVTSGPAANHPSLFASGMQDAREPDILVGTHALLYEKEPLPRLGLVVIDEQHKFGVLQRAQLSTGRAIPPDVLVMTATPIPRTLAITVYGDLDVSILDELPAGRGKIVTAVRPDSKLPEAAGFIRTHLAAGRQAYLVYPLIEESDKLTAKAATARYEHWKEVLAPFRCELLHGRMSPQEKEDVMRAFRDGGVQALIATTVIEVGIDVKNANLMLIENAERFGLAQLHQLRGRVGRGEHKSYCLLMMDAKASLEAAAKLQVLENSSDGFVIAEADMELRGPGDILGTAQSGLPPLKLGNLLLDKDLMQTARTAAREIFEADPTLSRPENRRFRSYIQESRKLMLSQVS